jgi:hypothetical protein
MSRYFEVSRVVPVTGPVPFLDDVEYRYLGTIETDDDGDEDTALSLAEDKYGMTRLVAFEVDAQGNDIPSRNYWPINDRREDFHSDG